MYLGYKRCSIGGEASESSFEVSHLFASRGVMSHREGMAKSQKPCIDASSSTYIHTQSLPRQSGVRSCLFGIACAATLLADTVCLPPTSNRHAQCSSTQRARRLASSRNGRSILRLVLLSFPESHSLLPLTDAHFLFWHLDSASNVMSKQAGHVPV